MKLSFRAITTSAVATVAAFAAVCAVAAASTAGGLTSERSVTAVHAPKGVPATPKPVNIWGP
ncbi:hypothetical protein BU52_32045 [Streptomyces toyocaensis]|uniref:Lipoprotein n=1 Tax=Streptomyces toyocaensis TaxID=55952 RepID=A0A081XHY6_STRTO|nr:hypothetical protein [Streptomyces toyocaensis]KES03159.1 hypothetical protein BU52_32045 [Streptomyces toyocaensis]